ncbi:MAG: cupredoxin domain-containing protein [Acidimicrobiales bacterium]
MELDERSAGRRTLAIYALGAIMIVAVPLALARMFDQPEGALHTFVIPLGTSDRIAAGEEVNIIPADLDVKLNDRLIITNNDAEIHTIGAFTVAPSETADVTFGQVASFSGFCSLHGSGKITIDVD